MVITDKQLQAIPGGTDRWLVDAGPRGAGRFVARITAGGERLFYYRYTDPRGARVRLPLGSYDSKGKTGLRLAEARAKAAEYSRLYQSGVRDLRGHLEQIEAEAARAAEDELVRQEQARLQAAEAAHQAEIESQRRITIRQLFGRWAATDLTPHVRADGTRTGRKDGGKFAREQFARRIFPVLGETPASELRKSDVLAILDAVKAEGKLRTCNMLLSDMKQMLRFAVTREIIPFSPLESITKRHAGGKDVERDRVLSKDEVRRLARALPQANMSARSQLAVWTLLATGCRIGELMNARWDDVHFSARRWHLPETKNERDHTIHLSNFALRQLKALLELREDSPWVFPNNLGTGPVSNKSFGKQLADRQRPIEKRMKHRTKACESLLLSGGKWTAHDLRRTAATFMAGLGVSSDVIDECLNHMIQSRVTRTYIRDRRATEQVLAFDQLGKLLTSLTKTPVPASSTTRKDSTAQPVPGQKRVKRQAAGEANA